jgi:hypothetical protein
MPVTPDRLDAYAALLRQPDPPELPPRRHHLTYAGRPDRLETLVVPLLIKAAVWRAEDLSGRLVQESSSLDRFCGRESC